MNKKNIFLQRREIFFAKMQKNSIAILPASPLQTRSPGFFYNYRPESNFYYLTNFSEINSVAVFLKGNTSTKFILFCMPKNKLREIWDGERFGPDAAKEIFSADFAYTIDMFDAKIVEFLAGKEHIYYSQSYCNQFGNRVKEIITKANKKNKKKFNFVNFDCIINQMRLIKSADEIKIIKKSATIAALAHKKVMQTCGAGMYEYELAAELLYFYNKNGAPDVSFAPIVAGGNNACTMHYTNNNCKLKSGNLVLVDSGCEYQYYASDITRTFPINGKFSFEQRQIYDIVLKAQEAAIKSVRPGNPCNLPQEIAIKIITSGLCDLGILCGNVDDLIAQERYKEFYMTNVGHWVGMDVHDVGEYKNIDKTPVLYVPGMITTIEPGIYIAAKNSKVAKKWWGIGVRIEDELLITKNGNEIITNDVPKNVDEIEILMQH